MKPIIILGIIFISGLLCIYYVQASALNDTSIACDIIADGYSSCIVNRHFFSVNATGSFEDGTLSLGCLWQTNCDIVFHRMPGHSSEILFGTSTPNQYLATIDERNGVIEFWSNSTEDFSFDGHSLNTYIPIRIHDNLGSWCTITAYHNGSMKCIH